MSKIKFLFLDVDGTLTDGKIYMAETGELFKTFDVKDGCGIKDILPMYEIIPVVITARNSRMLLLRCKEIGVDDVYQNERNKLEKMQEVLREYSKKDGTVYSFSNCAYIGDDILDLQCMMPIKKAGGKIGCPIDAVKKVKYISDFVSEHRGGDGAVRDFIEWLVEHRKPSMD